MSEILKSADSSKQQKSQYLESKTLIFRQLKKFIYYRLSGIIWQKAIF